MAVPRPDEIPTYIDNGRTKRTNVLRPKKYQHTRKHGRTKRTYVPRPNKIPTSIDNGRTKRTNVLRPKKYQHT